jgi:hypothetical protein
MEKKGKFQMLGNYSRLSVGGNSCCFTLPFAVIVDLLRRDDYIRTRVVQKKIYSNNNNKTALKVRDKNLCFPIARKNHC